MGLQLIAWLLLGSTGIRAIQYLVEAIELRKKKEFSITIRKQYKLSTLFKMLGILVSLGIAGYFGTVIYSGMNLGFDLHDSYSLDHDDGGTPGVYGDDSFIITLQFDVTNNGIYAIHDVILNAEIICVTSSDPVLLPFDTKIGGSPVPYQNTFHSFTQTLNQSISVSIGVAYIEGLLTENANLLFRITFSTLYAWIFITLTISLPVSW